ncbi:type I-F CRISPR-associated protein Csy2 [Pseudomonas aeruginosa]|uniref:type I-F CRISPR-associated protein Csy2 n=1 Tax=Pseudomonas aeruginosa TaxID=287 RepID=UPI00223DC2BA|nr:type I-F CRISPR-associated protein Csy2 [Pseudomonas aeruginosa]
MLTNWSGSSASPRTGSTALFESTGDNAEPISWAFLTRSNEPGFSFPSGKTFSSPHPAIVRSVPVHPTLSRSPSQVFLTLSHLLPGFALVSREALLQQHLETLRTTLPEATTLDALLDLCRINFEPPATSSEEEASPPDAAWQVRDKPGWLVPIPAGYNALSPLYLPGEVRNARDRETPLRFVENLFGLGEWLSPHRVAALSDLLWYHHAEPDKGLYRWSTPRFVEHAIA